jgi:acetyl-CoA carboxylase carboxyl transferase subunit alpha
MLKNSIYSVISPEGCAAILWKNAEQASLASASLKLTAEDLLQLKIVDRVLDEPLDGAHSSTDSSAKELDVSLSECLHAAEQLSQRERLDKRYKKLRQLGL